MAGFTMADFRRQQAAQSANSSPVNRNKPVPTNKSNVGNAFWVNPYGEILDIGHGKHITSITQAPEKFGFTLDEIKDAHEKYGEPMGIEGKAREDLIKDAMQRGFIHIRLYPNKFWAVNAWRFHKKIKQALSKWAEKAMNHPGAGKNMPVRLYSLEKNEIVGQTTMQNLYYGMDESMTDFIPRFVESIEEFQDYKEETLPTFLQYIAS